MKTKSILLYLLLVFALALFTGCATIGGSDHSTKAKATTDYLLMNEKLLDTKANIEVSCPHVPEIVCSTSREYYNTAADVYVISGDLFKILNDPENKADYMGSALAKLSHLDSDYELLSSYSQEIFALLGYIVKSEDLSTEEQVIQLATLMETKLIDVITEMFIKSLPTSEEERWGE